MPPTYKLLLIWASFHHFGYLLCGILSLVWRNSRVCINLIDEIARTVTSYYLAVQRLAAY